MAVQIVRCPTCRQKLAVQEYVIEGSLVVCANVRCGASLRLIVRRPARVELVAKADTHTPDYRPESYG